MIEHATYDGREAFAAGRCVLFFTLALEEYPLSPASFVGTPVVHNRRVGADGALVACTPGLCPSAVLRDDGQLINLARPVISRMGHVAIDQRSNRKDWGWRWIQYLQTDDVWFSLAMQSKVTPMTNAQFDSSNWISFIENRLPTLLDKGLLPDNATAVRLAASMTARGVDSIHDYLSNRRTLISGAAIDVSNIVGNPFRQALFVDHVYTTQLACVTAAYRRAAPGFVGSVCGNFLLGNTHGFWDTASMGTPTAIGVLCGADPMATCGYQQDNTSTWIVGFFSFGKGLTYNASLLADALAQVDVPALRRAFLVDAATRLTNVLPTGDSSLTESEARKPYLQKLHRQFRQPTRPESDGSCGVGYQSTALMPQYCMPCPKGTRPAGLCVRALVLWWPCLAHLPRAAPLPAAGTHYNASYPTKCQLCPVGTYVDSEGALVCALCPNPSIFSTMKEGGSSRADCSVPRLNLSPSYPELTQVEVQWKLFGYEIVQADRKASLSLGVHLTWRDDRLARFDSSIFDMGLTESDWRSLGMWLPSMQLNNYMAETSAVASNFLVDVSIGTGGVTSAQVTWERSFTSADIRFLELSWSMFPFGRHVLPIELYCSGDTACMNTTDDGFFMKLPDSDASAQRRRNLVARGAGVAAAGYGGGYGGLETARADESWTEVRRTYSVVEDTGRLRIELELGRSSILYMMRIIIPTLFCVVITVFVFFTDDVYNQLTCSFTAILILSVVAVEVSWRIVHSKVGNA